MRKIMTAIDDSISSVTGFRIKKYTSTEGKGDKDSGKLQVILEADVDDIRCLEHNVGDIVSAFNLHQRAYEPVVLKIRFPDDD
jgi:hypothetical protein